MPSLQDDKSETYCTISVLFTVHSLFCKEIQSAVFFAANIRIPADRLDHPNLRCITFRLTFLNLLSFISVRRAISSSEPLSTSIHKIPISKIPQSSLC